MSAKPRAAVVLLQILLIAAAIPGALRSVSTTAPSTFMVAAPAVRSGQEPLYAGEFLPGSSTSLVHGATMAELPNGDLIAAWYGGTDEAGPDVKIFATTQDHRTGRWSEPRVIEDRAGAAGALGTHVKSIGNPVLFADARGARMFYVAILFGGWSGGTICMKGSPDGVRWSGARRLVTSPFLNIGMLVRGAPLAYRDGSLALPIYHELLKKWSAVARVDRSGQVVDEIRVGDSRPLIQPWLVAMSPDRVVALLRWFTYAPGRVTLTTSADAGMHWSGVSTTPLVHRDSAVAGVRLGDGSLLALYNNSAWGRRDLSMARSPDGGVHWSKPHPIEHDTAPSDDSVRREYSYPFVLQSRDGRYHLTYTWQRSRIRHVVFNDSWVEADPLLKEQAR
jgi:predicted neuraminidase